MRRVGLDILLVRLDQLGCVFDHQQVLRVLLFSGFGEIEGAGDDRGPVDHHDFVVGDGVLGVNERLDTRVDQERGGAVLLRLLRFIEDGEHVDATFVRVDQRFGDGC
jgi:hypothetical protein